MIGFVVEWAKGPRRRVTRVAASNRRRIRRLKRRARHYGWTRRRTRRVDLPDPDPHPNVIGDLDGLDPDLVARLDRVGLAIGRTIYIRSGFRSYAQQQILWRNYQAGVGPLAARPGTSRHESGGAADCQLDDRDGLNIGDHPDARAAMRKHGLCLPVPGERWHVEAGNTWRA